MRRISLFIALLLTVTMHAAGGDGHFHKSFRQQNVPLANVERQFAEWFSLPTGTEWRQVSRQTDGMGMTRMEYRQYVGGVEVEHSQILLHGKDGRLLVANGVVMESRRTPSEATGYGAAPGYFSPARMEGELLLVDTPEGYRYATKRYSAEGVWVYTDVTTGEVVKRVPAFHTFTNDGGTPATVQGTGIYCGNVSLSATKLGDGSYGLFDSERNIYTLNAARILSLDTLAKHGRLADYFPADVIPAEKTSKTLADMKRQLMTNKTDISAYLRSGGVITSTDNEFYAYRLKKMTIERAKAADEAGTVFDMMPATGSPAVIRTQFRYGKTDGALYDYLYQYLNPAATVVIDDVAQSNVVLPREGVTLNLIFGKPKGQGSEEQIVRKFVVYFVPDASGKTVVDREDLKLTIEYERGGSPAVDAHMALCNAYDYYKEVFGRKGYDGKGAPVYNTMFLPSPDNLMTLIPVNEASDHAIAPGPNDPIDEVERTINYVVEMTMFNAGVNRNYNPFFMAVGMGGNVWKHKAFMLPVAEKSILTHEYTHMITGTTAQLEYRNEPGAINESFSDIMAISLMKSAKFGNGPDAPWIVGAKLMTGFSCQRDMKNPKNGLDGKDPSPDTYKGTYWVVPEDNMDDAGGVHHNSGVQNKFYYLLCDGGKGTNDKGFAYDVTGIGIEKGQQIAFRTLVQYAAKQSDYADIRKCFIEAATDLYGETSAEVAAVKKAWEAVNVPDAGSTPDAISTVRVEEPTDLSTYDLSGRRVDSPSRGIYIRGGKKFVVK